MGPLLFNVTPQIHIYTPFRQEAKAIPQKDNIRIDLSFHTPLYSNSAMDNIELYY